MNEDENIVNVVNAVKGKLIDEDKKQLTTLGVFVCVAVAVRLVPYLIKQWCDSFKY